MSQDINEYLTLLNAPLLWNAGFTGKNINVAVVEDTILSIPNKLNIKGWFDTKTNLYTTTAPSVSNLSDHGFSTSSLIGGLETGLAPDCNLYNVIVDTKITDFNKTLSAIKKAIKWCITNNIDVINISLDIPLVDAELISLAKEASEKNIAIVCSLGNSSINNKSLFLCAGFIISVGAINKNKTLSSFSNFGDCMNFVSFGDAVPSYNSKGEIIPFNGTSCSAPLVSGLIALIKSQNNQLSYKEIQYILADSSEKLNLNIENNSITCLMPKAVLIPCCYKKNKDIKDIESKISIENMYISCEATIVEGQTITPIVSISPKLLNNQDIFITSSDESLTKINHFSNSITALKTGKPKLTFSIPSRNYSKSLTLNILSSLEKEIQSSLEMYNINTVQNNGFLGDGIKVAIVDTGVNKVGNIDAVTYGPNYIAYQSTTNVSDTYGQGTVTASIVKSIAPNCILYSIKNQSNAGYGYTNESLQLKALRWCLDNKMDIVIARNLQLGSFTSKDALFKTMNDAGIITIVDQNSGDATKFENDKVDNILCTGSLNSSKIEDRGYLDVTCYSNGFPAYNKEGKLILTSNSTLRHHFGIIGGICALLKQQNPNLNVTALRAMLPSLCTNIGEFKYFGYGIIKAKII